MAQLDSEGNEWTVHDFR